MGIQFVDKADLWKSALLLKLQLHDRFRDTFDDHRGRAAVFSPDGYFSSTIHRLLTRFRNFSKESLPSPHAFYSRRDLTAEEESALFRMLQAVAIPLIGNACHVFMSGFNRVQVEAPSSTIEHFTRLPSSSTTSSPRGSNPSSISIYEVQNLEPQNSDQHYR